MNNWLNNKTEVLSKLGSFWVKNTSRENPYGFSLVRSISRVVDEDGARIKSVESENALLSHVRKKGNYSLSFFPDEVYPIDAATPEIALSGDDIVLASSGDVVPRMSWGYGQAAHYVLRIPELLKPLSIRSSVGELCAGVSFVSGSGWIRFFITPHLVFPDRLLHIRSAESVELNLLDYTLRVDDTYNPLPNLALYYRITHAAAALELALNELAGRVIIKNDCVVTEAKRILDSDTYVYTTNDGEVYKVAYSHFPLINGELLYKNQIIGKAIDVFAKSKSGVDSWWQPAFSGAARGNTLNLQTLNPALPDVTITNEEVRFWAYEAVASTFHVRAEFTGITGDLDKYFSIVKRGELWADKYWNDVLGFTTLLEEDDINGLDFMFSHALHNAVIIDIDTYKLGEYVSEKIAYIAKREVPIGSVPIVRKWSSVG